MAVTPEKKALVLKLARGGKSGPYIKEKTGLRRNQIAGICHKAGVKITRDQKQPTQEVKPLDLLPNEGQCRWPSGGNTKDNPIHFACTVARTHGSYCTEHARKSVQPRRAA